jgi:hypothetical protein
MFLDLPPSEQMQAILFWVAQLVNHLEHLRAYFREHGIRLIDWMLGMEDGEKAEVGRRSPLRIPTPGERMYPASFYGVRQLTHDFLDTFGVQPLEPFTFLLQVVDPGFAFDRKEISRKMHSPSMVAMAKELLQVLGSAHPLDHGHVTATLEDLRPALESTTFFREYSKNVKLFNARALGNTTCWQPRSWQRLPSITSLRCWLCG